MLDLDALWGAFYGKIGEDRGDEHRLHGSDLGGCDYATYLRLQGEPSLPFDAASIDRFFTGHMVEHYVFGALAGLEATHGEVVDHDGIVGHIDFAVERCIIDVSTTRGKTAEPKYGHALKSAFYAHAKGYEDFAEWVFRIDYKGNVQKPMAYWFKVADFRDAIDARVAYLKKIEAGHLAPPMEPPPQMEWRNGRFVHEGALEAWRCRAYCEARCPRNAKVDPNDLLDEALT
jgi:hypothetical protein